MMQILFLLRNDTTNLVPAAVLATKVVAGGQEGVVESNVVQTTRATVPVTIGCFAGLLGLVHVVAAGAPGRDSHSLDTLAHDEKGENGDEGEREDLGGHL